MSHRNLARLRSAGRVAAVVLGVAGLAGLAGAGSPPAQAAAQQQTTPAQAAPRHATPVPAPAAQPAPEPAARAGACTGTTGVTVVVDFTAFGGGVTVACAPGDPDSGVEALQDAGFALTGTDRWGLAFICRIDGLPAPAAEPCVDTPPATAFWSYWHAEPGGDWAFSNLGAASFDPEPGTVEGWAFGAGGEPGISPP